MAYKQEHRSFEVTYFIATSEYNKLFTVNIEKKINSFLRFVDLKDYIIKENDISHNLLKTCKTQLRVQMKTSDGQIKY